MPAWTWLTASLLQFQAVLASHPIPPPPCIPFCGDPASCMVKLLVAIARAFMGHPC